MFYLTTHSTHFIYGYMASDIWLRTILIVRKETRCCHIGYSYRLIARVLLYAPSHRQDSTYHGLYYTSRGALAGTRNSRQVEWLSNLLENVDGEARCKSVCSWCQGLFDPLSYFSFQPVLHDWCNKSHGMCYPVCGIVHIKKTLLLIEKSSPYSSGSGFPILLLSEWSFTICPTPYTHIKMC